MSTILSTLATIYSPLRAILSHCAFSFLTNYRDYAVVQYRLCRSLSWHETARGGKPHEVCPAFKSKSHQFDKYLFGQQKIAEEKELQGIDADTQCSIADNPQLQLNIKVIGVDRMAVTSAKLNLGTPFSCQYFERQLACRLLSVPIRLPPTPA